MTIIDQRILIPAGPEVVWEQISDIANNPKWQADCRSVSFLTSVRDGPGIRWRSTNAAGREMVLEITTWYDRIGYEYTFVDGAPFRESKGRFRLQEIAEGTIVQWTFTYEIAGLLGNIRNSLSIKRQVENNMIDSLKSLWRHVNQSGGSQPFHEAKSLMRQALDYEERSKYRPRHPSALTDRKDMPEEFRPIPEPPIADDDTRPRPAVAIPADQPPVAAEPDFLSEMPASHADEAWMPKPAPEKPRDTQERKWLEPTPEFAPAANLDIPPAKTDTQPNTPIIVDAPKPPPTPADVDLMQPLRDISQLDTAQISIWEVFGVPRPSETQEIQPIKTETLSSPAPPTAEEKPLIQGPKLEETLLPELKVEEIASPAPEIEPVWAENIDEPVIAEPELTVIAETVISAPVIAETPSLIEVRTVGLRIVMRRKLVKLRRVR
jgi:uncharacterized membrane protein